MEGFKFQPKLGFLMASLRFSDWLETSNMKSSEIFQEIPENKAKEDYKPEKKVADHWQRTDSIHILIV